MGTRAAAEVFAHSINEVMASEHYHILAIDGKIVFAIRLGLDGQGNVVSSRVVKKPDEISADIEAWLQSIDV